MLVLVSSVLCLLALNRGELLVVFTRTVKVYPLFLEITTVTQCAVINLPDFKTEFV
jgi:hypothetical protein